MSKQAKEKFYEFGGDEEKDPVERLRFFCSLAMNGQDWLDVEPFFDAIKQQDAEPVAYWFEYNGGAIADGQSYSSSKEAEDAWEHMIESGAGKIVALCRCASPQPTKGGKCS